MVTLIESAISSFEAGIEGETVEDFKLRRKEVSTEVRASFQNLDKKDCWDHKSLQDFLIEAHKTGDQQVKHHYISWKGGGQKFICSPQV